MKILTISSKNRKLFKSKLKKRPKVLKNFNLSLSDQD